MKGTFFNKSLEWNIETKGESWLQGSQIHGTLSVKNHGAQKIDLANSGVALAYCDIKKVQSRAEGSFVPITQADIKGELSPGEKTEITFSFDLDTNCSISDKKNSYYLGYGENFSGSTLQLPVAPHDLFSKIVGLLDTFHRFKIKEIKSIKKTVEYKLAPPTSRELANLDSLLLQFSFDGENLQMNYQFQVKKLDTSSVTTKVNKESVKLQKTLTPKEYSLGRGLLNQDNILKSLEAAIAEVKLKSVF